jgi:hypothetical protein
MDISARNTLDRFGGGAVVPVDSILSPTVPQGAPKP